jgi:hypothetical protein
MNSREWSEKLKQIDESDAGLSSTERAKLFFDHLPELERMVESETELSHPNGDRVREDYRSFVKHDSVLAALEELRSVSDTAALRRHAGIANEYDESLVRKIDALMLHRLINTKSFNVEDNDRLFEDIHDFVHRSDYNLQGYLVNHPDVMHKLVSAAIDGKRGPQTSPLLSQFYHGDALDNKKILDNLEHVLGQEGKKLPDSWAEDLHKKFGMMHRDGHTNDDSRLVSEKILEILEKHGPDSGIAKSLRKLSSGEGKPEDILREAYSIGGVNGHEAVLSRIKSDPEKLKNTLLKLFHEGGTPKRADSSGDPEADKIVDALNETEPPVFNNAVVSLSRYPNGHEILSDLANRILEVPIRSEVQQASFKKLFSTLPSRKREALLPKIDELGSRSGSVPLLSIGEMNRYDYSPLEQYVKNYFDHALSQGDNDFYKTGSVDTLGRDFNALSDIADFREVPESYKQTIRDIKNKMVRKASNDIVHAMNEGQTSPNVSPILQGNLGNLMRDRSQLMQHVVNTVHAHAFAKRDEKLLSELGRLTAATHVFSTDNKEGLDLNDPDSQLHPLFKKPEVLEGLKDFMSKDYFGMDDKSKYLWGLRNNIKNQMFVFSRMDQNTPAHYGPAAEVDPVHFLDGYEHMAVKLGSSGLRALRTALQRVGGKLSTSKANPKLNPMRRTTINDRVVDDWSPFLDAEGQLSLSKLKDFREHVSTKPEGRSAVPKVDRILDHVLSTGNFTIDGLPPQLKSSPVKKKESTSSVTVDWEPISSGGNVDPAKLDSAIESIKDTPVRFFTGKYVQNAQVHQYGKQNLLTAIVHPEQLEQIQKEGLSELYEKIKEPLPTSGHPQDKNGLGWVRWNTQPTSEINPVTNMPIKEHHADEVQSDFDDMAKKILMRNSVEPYTGKPRTGPEFEEEQGKLTSGFKRLRDILYHGLEPADFLSEMWHQHMRNTGNVGDKYSIWSHKSKKKMKISGLDVDRPAPVDWQIAYGKKAIEAGAEPSTYGTVAPQTNKSLIGEPTFVGEIHKTEQLVKAESLAHLFHNADDKGIAQSFHVNSDPNADETLDELLATPEGKSSLAAYLQRSADTHHGQGIMQRLTDRTGPYWLRTLALPYERLTGENFLKHAGRHYLPSVANTDSRGSDEVLEHLLAHTPDEHRDDMLAPLRGTPLITNPSIVGTLANSVYRNDPAQLFHDYNIDPSIVNALPKNAQLGYLVYSMEKHGNAPLYGGRVSNAQQIGKSFVMDSNDAKELVDYARVRGIEAHSNPMLRSIVNENPRAKEFTGTQLSVKVGSAALRKLRDHLEKHGEMLPNQLPSGERWNTITKPIAGRNGTVQHVTDWNPLRNKAGKLSAESVQAYIDSMEPTTYDFELGQYDELKPTVDLEQIRSMVDEGTFKRMFNTKHSNAPQHVLRLKLSDADMEKLKATGADQTLNNLIGVGIQSGHPVTPRTVGWIRFTQGKDGHIMVDEAQSDLESNYEAIIRPQLQQMYPDATPPQIEAAMGQFLAKLPPAHIEQIKQVAFRGRPAAEVVNEALHQYARHKGWVGSKWHAHSAKSKAPISFDMSKPVPPHVKENYDEGNRALGAVPATYGELETQSQPKHDHLAGAPTWAEEFRKKEEG